MKPETFFDNFEVLAEAPNGVKKLREMILELAVRGKLVAQDERDEPVSMIVERIKEENKVQIKDQKTNNTHLFSPIMLAPFEIPKHWKWCRMGDIAEIIMGNSPPGESYNENGNGIALINGPVEFSKGHFGYTIKAKFTTKPTKLCKENDLLICVRGSTTGRTNIAGFQACIGRGVAVIRAKIHQEYVNYLVLSMRQQIYDLGTGSTFPSVSYGQLMELPIPLPPLEEQHRIFAKVDQLMYLCDELEARQQKKRETRARINSAALDRLLAARAPGEFAEGWRRISDNFDLLYDVPENVGALRKAILQLAVMGKLVAQDEEDEPADKLLARIQVERRAKWEAHLCSKGKDPKKVKYVEMQPPNNEGLPSLPKSWMWVTWEAILAYDDGAFKRGPFGSTLTKSIFVESGYKVYEQYCPINDDCSFGRYYITPAKFEELKTFEVKAGDYLVSCSGVTLGRITRVPQEFERGIINQALLRVRINDRIINHLYFIFLFRSPFFQKLLFDNSKGTAIPNVKGVKELKAIPIPLPPLDEQPRIVAKVGQLMSLCDQLEAGLMRSQADSEKLMEAVVGKMLAGE